MDNPRKLALASLVKADTVSSFSNIEVNTTITRSNMSKSDSALYTALYLGVVERLLTLDYLISAYSSIKIDQIDIETKNALRLGLYQLAFMDKIPEYSAVSESVELCKKRSKGFVNAVLRAFIRADKKIPLPADKWQKISISASIPMDIINIYRDSYGDECAEKIISALTPEKGISLRINTLKASKSQVCAELEKRAITHTYSPIFDEAIVAHAPISDIKDMLDEGIVFVQDLSSLTAVKVLAPEPNQAILDACACPGGKSFSCAIEMENKGKILSCDLHKSKLSLIEKGAKRLGIDIIEIREQNGKIRVAELEGTFDKVLCDVPCSGLGVIAKKPDIKYKSVEQISALPSVQYAILENCSAYVKIGGELMYSTCTLNSSENEQTVRKFLDMYPNFEPVELKIGEEARGDGMYTFMPHITKTDGFFVAKMKRIK